MSYILLTLSTILIVSDSPNSNANGAQYPSAHSTKYRSR